MDHQDLFGRWQIGVELRACFVPPLDQERIEFADAINRHEDIQLDQASGDPPVVVARIFSDALSRRPGHGERCAAGAGPAT
jgi:hypothetical protein